MPKTLQWFIIVGVFIFLFYVLLRLRKLRVKMEDTIFWICFAVLVAILGVVPEIAYWMSWVLKIISPANFVFLVIIALLIEKLFTVSMKLSLLEEKVTVLAAEIALRSHETEMEKLNKG